MRALHGGLPLRAMHVSDALALVYSLAVRNMSAEDREDFDGWMTCTWEQALDFVRERAGEEQEGRLAAARMIGGLG